MKKPTNLITSKEASQMSNDFSAKNKLISKDIGKPNNCSTWYSLADLEEYIAYIKAEGKAKGYNIDGIRFYLGSYSKSNRNVKKQKQTTVFLAPTGTKTGVQKTKAVSQNLSSPDISAIEAFNMGQSGWPPNSGYPNK